ncbi:c-type cytochrome [Variovorax sp. dw_308]|uniref:c-type cytochrome n=1 Tax=Variovorax sp. dw_308 TaxID=2721546 RepID=UPI001C462530|nr:c-type cytochrome [Variovorax sp. dw_308]
MQKSLAVFFSFLACSTIAAPQSQLANCLACHQQGSTSAPTFRQIAHKYADQPAAVQTLSNKIRNGSTGTWGTTSMPANPGITDADAKQLASWVLKQK